MTISTWSFPLRAKSLRRDAHFRARVSGQTDAGHAFEEENCQSAILTLHGAYSSTLDHSPKLQSELQVQLDNPGIDGSSDSPLRLRGYVVRIEAQEDKENAPQSGLFLLSE